MNIRIHAYMHNIHIGRYGLWIYTYTNMQIQVFPNESKFQQPNRKVMMKMSKKSSEILAP